jgi:pentose-5-phosphate-3-epimerase
LAAILRNNHPISIDFHIIVTMPRHYHPEITDIHPNIMSTKNSSTKKARFSSTS